MKGLPAPSPPPPPRLVIPLQNSPGPGIAKTTNGCQQNEDPGWGQGACRPAPGLLTWQADLNDSPGSYY